MRYNDLLTLTRQAAGSRDENGEWIAGAESAATIRAKVVPMFRKDLDHPEGERIEGEIQIFAPVALALGDSLEYADEYYRVTEARTWTRRRTVIREAVATRIEGQAGSIPDETEAGTDAVARWLRRGVALATELYTADADGNIIEQRVIPGSGEGDAPSGTFAAVTRLSTIPQTSAAINYWNESTETETVGLPVEAVFLIGFYRAGAADAAHDFMTWIDSRNFGGGFDYQTGDNVPKIRSWTDGEGLERSDEQIGEKIETRYMLELTVGYYEVRESEVLRLASAEIEINHDPSGIRETVDVDSD